MSDGIKAVLFDFEGTLVDFQWQLAVAEPQLRQAFADLGYATAGSYAELWNAAAAAAAKQGRLDQLRAALYPLYDRWDADAQTRWSPRPGAAQLLRTLEERGIAAALVSNCGRSSVNEVLQRFGMAKLLFPIVGRDDVTYMKPHAEGIRHVLGKLAVAAGSALFVGDSRTDVRAARAAGLPVVIIRGGECSEEEFASLPPDHMVTQLGEIAALLTPARPADPA